MLHLERISYPTIEHNDTSMQDPSEPESFIHYSEDLRFMDFNFLIKKNPFRNDVKLYGLVTQSSMNHNLQTTVSIPVEGEKKEPEPKNTLSNFNYVSADLPDMEKIFPDQAHKKEPEAVHQDEEVKKPKKKKAKLIEMRSEDLGGRVLKGILKKGDKAKYSADSQLFGFYSSSEFKGPKSGEFGSGKKIRLEGSLDARFRKKNKAIRRLNSAWPFGRNN